jgi:hypothetical protein
MILLLNVAATFDIVVDNLENTYSSLGIVHIVVAKTIRVAHIRRFI